MLISHQIRGRRTKHVAWRRQEDFVYLKDTTTAIPTHESHQRAREQSKSASTGCIATDFDVGTESNGCPLAVTQRATCLQGQASLGRFPAICRGGNDPADNKHGLGRQCARITDLCHAVRVLHTLRKIVNEPIERRRTLRRLFKHVPVFGLLGWDLGRELDALFDRSMRDAAVPITTAGRQVRVQRLEELQWRFAVGERDCRTS